MWFFNQRRRVREVIRTSAEGLRDGTLVLDPPLAPHQPLPPDPPLAKSPELAWPPGQSLTGRDG